jgi:glycerol-3-phosphate dehydrogenase
LVSLYGDDWMTALRRVVDAPSLGEPLLPGLPVLAVEEVMAREREMALTAEDVLVRRTRLAAMDAQAAATSATGALFDGSERGER